MSVRNATAVVRNMTAVMVATGAAVLGGAAPAAAVATRRFKIVFTGHAYAYAVNKVAFGGGYFRASINWRMVWDVPAGDLDALARARPEVITGSDAVVSTLANPGRCISHHVTPDAPAAIESAGRGKLKAPIPIEGLYAKGCAGHLGGLGDWQYFQATPSQIVPFYFAEFPLDENDPKAYTHHYSFLWNRPLPASLDASEYRASTVRWSGKIVITVGS